MGTNNNQLQVLEKANNVLSTGLTKTAYNEFISNMEGVDILTVAVHGKSIAMGQKQAYVTFGGLVDMILNTCDKKERRSKVEDLAKATNYSLAMIQRYAQVGRILREKDVDFDKLPNNMEKLIEMYKEESERVAKQYIIEKCLFTIDNPKSFSILNVKQVSVSVNNKGVRTVTEKLNTVYIDDTLLFVNSIENGIEQLSNYAMAYDMVLIEDTDGKFTLGYFENKESENPEFEEVSAGISLKILF